ncbi:MAG: putative zinc-binding metallopeptidase [Prevotellaceae bacterium]|jgi:substrate import-associated zinc metallohydrolase lipoprotein|nr:putative zinc-binding metallopeptidase [Prevotellaceae bacterium]
MKRNLFYLFLATMLSVAVACSEEALSDISVIKDTQREENEFDRWIISNYIIPYNIAYKYRMEDIESDMNYHLVPADYVKAKQLAKLTIHLCLGAYDEATGSRAFIAENFPKMIHIIGSSAVNNNGTEIIGQAEGGQKITLYKVNDLDLTNIVHMNTYFFHTMHHEFAHILHQKKPYSNDFKAITPGGYRKDSWNDYNDAEALKAGFITPYGSSAPDEDFVELISTYITDTPAEWNTRLIVAGATGRSYIEAKFEIVDNYLRKSWNIDLNALRDIVQYRQSTIGSLDFNF